MELKANFDLRNLVFKRELTQMFPVHTNYK